MTTKKVIRRRVPAAKSKALTQPDLPMDGLNVQRKKVVIVRKAVADSDKEGKKEGMDSQLARVITNLELRARTYRLSMGGLGDYRSLRSDERSKVMKEDMLSVKASKRLYDPADFHLKAVSQAQTGIRDFFRAFTIAHPEPGTRMFVVKHTWNDTTATTELIETEMAQQLDKFHDTMSKAINTYYDTQVQAVVDHWDEVMSRAEAFNGVMFDIKQYPAKAELRDLLYVKFYPVPSVLPPEYNRIDPHMRQQIASQIRQQMETSLAQQLLDVEDTLTKSLEGLQENLVAANVEGASVRFYSSRITHVQEAIEMYQRSMDSMGLSLGTALPRRLEELKAALSRSGDDTRKAISQLKTSSVVRSEVLASVKSAIDSASSAFAPVRRRITVR